MDLGYGTAAGATDIRDKEPFSRHCGIQKRTGDCPWAGRRHWVTGVSGSDAPVLDGLYQFYLLSKADKSKSTVRTSARLGSSFLDHLGWDSRWFHRPQTARPGFSLAELGRGRTSGGYR
jgi:hypothetical protein